MSAFKLFGPMDRHKAFMFFKEWKNAIQDLLEEFDLNYDQYIVLETHRDLDTTTGIEQIDVRTHLNMDHTAVCKAMIYLSDYDFIDRWDEAQYITTRKSIIRKSIINSNGEDILRTIHRRASEIDRKFICRLRELT